ncbi:MAG: calcium/sodium antiporter [Armatimonadota bacterium]
MVLAPAIVNLLPKEKDGNTVPPSMTQYLFILLIGLVCAGGGGELFIRGAVGLAAWARIPAGIIGATVAAFATSSPELSVAISSSLAGTPQISVGDAVGSNIVNIGAILGIALLMSPTRAPREGLRRDFPTALLVPVALGLLALDGYLSRGDGFILLCLFVAWLVATVIEARRVRAATLEGEATEQVLSVKPAAAVLMSLGGLVLLVISGRTIVSGAVGIASAFGLDSFVIGATVVALGTSVPELATTVLAKLRGHQEVAMGTILGSNIFNGLFIIGVAAVIAPVHLSLPSVAAGLAVGAVLTICAYPPASGVLPRSRGGVLLVLYAVYVTMLLLLRPGAGAGLPH